MPRNETTVKGPFGFTLKGNPSDIKSAFPLVVEGMQRIRNLHDRCGNVTTYQVELVATSVCVEAGQDHRISQVKAALLGMLDSMVGCAGVFPTEEAVNEPAQYVPTSKGLAEALRAGCEELKHRAQARAPMPSSSVTWIDPHGSEWRFESLSPTTIGITREPISGDDPVKLDVTLIGDRTPSLIDKRNT
jgi:hypothetical protein